MKPVGIGLFLRKITFRNIIICAILTLWALIIVLPFYNIIIVSISPFKEYTRNPFLIFPQKPTLDSYVALFETNRIWVGYRTTMMILAIGLPLNLFLITLTAYALSRDNFPLKKAILYTILFTMFFSGGIIPLYLVVKELGLTNSIFSVIFVSGFNAFYFILTRNYMQSLPSALTESARIDGAREFTIFFRIILPLSAPILATVGLFCAVDRWNEWFFSMLFLRKNTAITLQNVLRSIINDARMEELMGTSGSGTLAAATRSVKGMKMAAIIVTMAPIMLIYPFIQKFFVKGIVLGSVKA